MSYSNPLVVTYAFPAVNFATSSYRYIKAPNGYTSGRILDVGAGVTTVFTNVTTDAMIQVGNATTISANASMNMGVAAAGTYYNTQDKPLAITSPGVTNATVKVSFIASTGATPTGAGDVYLVIAWF